MARISPQFPLSHGVPRVDDRRVVSGIVYVIKNGLQWKDAPKGYGPHRDCQEFCAVGRFHQLKNRSPKRTANCVFASTHS
ncbi:transposase, partial [Sinorhizobium medicae]|uniref:transposase n=1 Tax=Sinorhizobium medicae TaxID=110321 RepID=UPI001AEC8809